MGNSKAYLVAPPRRDGENPLITCWGTKSRPKGAECRARLDRNSDRPGRARDLLLEKTPLKKIDIYRFRGFFCSSHDDQAEDVLQRLIKKNMEIIDRDQHTPRTTPVDREKHDRRARRETMSEPTTPTDGTSQMRKKEEKKKVRKGREPISETHFYFSDSSLSLSEDEDDREIQQKLRNFSLHSRPANLESKRAHSDTSATLYRKDIPGGLPSSIVKRLKEELEKPPSPEQPGHIYVYRLKEDLHHVPPTRSASIIYNEGQKSRESHRHHQSETRPQRLLFKIGYTNDIERRMKAWKKCGFKPILVACFPPPPPDSLLAASYSPSTTPTPSPPRPRRRSNRPSIDMPPLVERSHSDSALTQEVRQPRRVERLIFTELDQQRVDRWCASCHCHHEEWFTVGPPHKGEAEVLDVVERWVKFDRDRNSTVY